MLEGLLCVYAGADAVISTDKVEDVPAKVKEITGGKLAYAVRRPVYTCAITPGTHATPATHAVTSGLHCATLLMLSFSLCLPLRKDRTRRLTCQRQSRTVCCS